MDGQFQGISQQMRVHEAVLPFWKCRIVQGFGDSNRSPLFGAVHATSCDQQTHHVLSLRSGGQHIYLRLRDICRLVVTRKKRPACRCELSHKVDGRHDSSAIQNFQKIFQRLVVSIGFLHHLPLNQGKTSIQAGGFRARGTQIQGAKMGRIKGKDPKISSHEIHSEGFWEWPKFWNFTILKHTKTSKTSFVSALSHFSCQSISGFVNPILFCRMVNMQSLFRNQISGYLWHPLVRFPQ